MSDPILWPFARGGEVTEQLEWLTDVLPVATGPAQTRRLRNAPRVTLTFDGMEEARSRRLMENLVHRNGAGLWHVPLPCDGFTLAADAPAGALLLGANGGVGRFTDAAMLEGSPGSVERVSVAAAGTDGLTLAVPTMKSWPAGTTVLPLVRARLADMPAFSRFTGDAISYQVNWLLDAPQDWAPAPLPTYRGFPVFEWVPDWSQDPRWAPVRRLSVVDYGTGPWQTFDLVGKPEDEVALQLAAVGPAEISALRDLVYALAGRWQPVWVSTRGQDLRVVAPAAAAGDTLDVEACGLVGAPVSATRRDLRIELAGGNVLYRRVVAISAVGDDVERLLLDTPLGADVSPENVGAASWMLLARQTADINKFRYWTADVVQTELAFKGEPAGV